jgi:hypothetical protein
MASGVGAATRAPGAPGSPVGVPAGADDGSAKKNIDPKLIGGGAFLLVAGVVAFLVNSSMSGGAVDAPIANPDPAPPSAPFVPPAPPPPGPLPAPAPNTGNQPVVPLPFTLVSAPNPRFPTGTAGVVATGSNLSPAQASGVARSARAVLARGGKWTSMQVLVFADQQSAQAFTAFQSKRQGSPLQGGDYQTLAAQGLWSGTIAYLDARGKSEKVYYPSIDPNRWWGSIGR